jgi:FolB domain-containing protein
MDKIHIRDLLVRCIIGVFDRERDHKQDVVLSITLHTDARRAAGTDALEDTVDYVALRDRVITYVESSSFHLIESLAEAVAEICLAAAGVEAVDVTVDKPGALTYARSVAVEIHRAAD